MRVGWFGVVVSAVVGCGDPFPPIDNGDPVPLDDTSPDDTAPPSTPDPIDTAPTGDTGEPPDEPTEPRPDDITYRIDLERLELLTQNCDGGTNGPAAEIYYELQVGDQNGFPLFLRIEPGDSVDMFPVGHPNAVPLELDSDPVELHLNEDGNDSLFIIGQVWDDDLLSRDLIATFDVVWSDPADVELGTTTFTREGPTENDPDDRCSISLIVTIEQIDPKPAP